MRGRNHLITLKRRTGIPNWNVLCRWAFCASRADPTQPLEKEREPGGHQQVEMTWRTLSGEFSEGYWALLEYRCRCDGIEPTRDRLAEQLRLHIHRGIDYLVGNPNLTDISVLVQMATNAAG